ncbi:MAG: glutaminyl-peptide cyclotransferase [Hyphomonadaceae bacterium]
MMARMSVVKIGAMMSLLAAGCGSPQASPTSAADPAAEAQEQTAGPTSPAVSQAASPAPAPTPAAPKPVIRQSYEIVRQMPHDTAAFTQGLYFHDGILFESTGRYGESQVRKLDPDTGEATMIKDLPETVFGEGSARWGDKMIVLTWRSGTGFVVDQETLETVSAFSYPGEGWGLTANDSHLIQSNGSDQLLFLDPETFKITKRVRVTLNGNPLRNLNELEWIEGEVWANVWQADQIVRIDPESGHVLGVIDLTGLFPAEQRNVPLDDVLNGIAYDADTQRIFVTGKHWPSLFEIRILTP